MRDVLQNTARKFKIYMADASDPTAALTGLSSFTVYLSKESGAENAVSPTITERGHGFYEVTPTTAHRDTLGENSWVFTHAGAVDFPRVETVVAVDNQIVAYDALRPTTTLRTLDVSAAGNAGIDWSNIEAPTTAVALTGTTVSLTAAAVALIWDALTSGISTVGSIGKRIVDFLTGDAFVRLGAPAGASIAADIATRASAAQISALQVNTRTNLQVPIEIETPDAGTEIWKIRLHLYDVEGNMEAPDGTPTVTLTNAAGTDRSSRLSAASNPSTGVYTWDYTSTAADAEEQLIWLFTVIEGALTRTYPATSYVVEETAYRFSSTDRATLNATATASGLSAATAAIQGSQATNAQTGATAALTAYGVPTNAQMEARTLPTASYALASVFTGITSLGDWLRRGFRKDAGTAGMTTAENEIKTGGTATFVGTTDNLEAIKDAGGGGGGGGGDATEANQITMLALLNAIKLKTDTIGVVTVTATGYAQLVDGTLILKQGHTATITFTGDSADIVSDLTGNKCFFGIKDSAGRTWLSIEGTIVTPNGTQVVSFTLTPALAKQLEEGEHYFDVVAIYGYNASLTPPYTGLQIFTSGRVHVDRLHVTIA